MSLENPLENKVRLIQTYSPHTLKCPKPYNSNKLVVGTNSCLLQPAISVSLLSSQNGWDQSRLIEIGNEQRGMVGREKEVVGWDIGWMGKIIWEFVGVIDSVIKC